jgi:hypothetical protein
VRQASWKLSTLSGQACQRSGGLSHCRSRLTVKSKTRVHRVKTPAHLVRPRSCADWAEDNGDPCGDHTLVARKHEVYRLQNGVLHPYYAHAAVEGWAQDHRLTRRRGFPHTPSMGPNACISSRFIHQGDVNIHYCTPYFIIAPVFRMGV